MLEMILWLLICFKILKSLKDDLSKVMLLQSEISLRLETLSLQQVMKTEWSSFGVKSKTNRNALLQSLKMELRVSMQYVQEGRRIIGLLLDVKMGAFTF